MNRIVILIIALFTGTPVFTSAQKKTIHNRVQISPAICYASDEVKNVYVPPPYNIHLKSLTEKQSDIIVNYSLFPEKAKTAFEYAVTIWENIVQSDVPIYIQANWRSLEDNVLGSAGPSVFLNDFENIPHKNTFYPIAVAERITKTEITGPSTSDINSSFNQDVNWYFGTDGNTPDSLYDFVTVVLHEIAHGLGFTGFFYVDGNIGNYDLYESGDHTAFDFLVVDNNNNQLIDTNIYPLQSNDLKNALTSDIFLNSPIAIKENGGVRPELYAPGAYDDGSSVYHLNDAVFPSNLLGPRIGRAEAIHNPGDLVTGIMADLGWKHTYIYLDKPKDLEEVKPIDFNVSLESDFDLDTDSLFVVYSTDDFENHIDSLLLLATGETGQFSVQLAPEMGTEEIHYYISTADIIDRTFRLPTEAPAEFYEITIGPDNEKPEVVHSPPSYFILDGEELQITVSADDNLGIDTVYFEYEINGIPQEPLGLAHDSATIYTGTLNFVDLTDGDEISYNIIAEDSSQGRNTTKIPFKDKFSFKAEGIFDPVTKYQNDFNQSTNDFAISDFDIYTEDGFEDGALHSEHSYLSPDEDNIYWNFSTILKRPVILSENGEMTYDEIVLVEPAEPLNEFGDDEFWDYVIVEGSKDKGKNWHPFYDGYDASDNRNWESKYNENIVGNNSVTTGSPDLFVSRRINLLENGNFSIGDTVLIRFRLYSDPYAHGWGWAIDNLRIQIPVSSPITNLFKGSIHLYPNPFSERINLSVHPKNNIDKLEFEVFNFMGQKIYSTQFFNVIGNFKEQIEMSFLNPGMYLISIKENGNQVYTKKIIKH